MQRAQLQKNLLTSHVAVVTAITVIMFAAFSMFLDGFFDVSNLLTLLRSVSVLGILGIGMAVVVISRGIDLSMVASLVIGAGVAVVLSRADGILGFALPFWVAVIGGLLLVILVTSLTGFLVAYAELPPVFATLAMGGVIYGLGRVIFLPTEANYLPPNADWAVFLGRGQVFGIPMPVICFAILLAAVNFILRRTAFGLLLFAMGDNPVAARSAGAPVRPLTIFIYVFSGVISFFAGLMTTGAVNNINTRMYNSTMIYDVLLVVVVGGIGLSGGKGGMKNVLLGTLMIGILLNGMIIMNVSYTEQNLLKGALLLLAILADTLLNPRDEQTSQSGDI